MHTSDTLLSSQVSAAISRSDLRRAWAAYCYRAFALSSLEVCMLASLVAVTACSESSGGNAAAKGGVKANGGAAGATSTKFGGAAGATSTEFGGQAGAGSGGCPVATAGQPASAVCDMPAKWVGAIVKPTPLVSLNKPVFTNSAEAVNKGLLVDGKYHGSGSVAFNPTATTTTWASINVGTGYTRLQLQWQDVGFQDYGPSLYGSTDYKSATSPTGYLIKTSANSTNGDDGTWTTVATVTDNEARARSHVFEFTDMGWVRFEVTAAPTVTTGEMRVVRIDEIELHDYSAIGPTDLADGWMIMGDSITKMSFDRSRGANEFDELIAAAHSAYTPAVVEAGNGGEKITDALRHINTEQWLAYSEGLTFVTLAYGTNDSWGGTTPTAAGFKDTLSLVVEALVAAGRVPVLARIPFDTVSTSVPQFNAVIDELQQKYELPCGPDLYGLIAAHPEYIGATATVQPNCSVRWAGSDGVHPQSPAAKNAIQKAYADALLPLYPGP